MQFWLNGNCMAIFINVGGFVILVMDYLVAKGGELVQFIEKIYEKFSESLFVNWSYNNLVNVCGNVFVEVY